MSPADPERTGAGSGSAARAQAHFARDGAIMEWSLARPAAEVPQRHCRRRSRYRPTRRDWQSLRRIPAISLSALHRGVISPPVGGQGSELWQIKKF